MELKNKIDWQVKNLKDCGLSIQAVGRNEFHVIAADVENFAYYWTKKEPKTFENTSKTGKKYFVLAWHFDNVSKWVSIPTFKKIVVEDWYLIALERKYTSIELIKELDIAAVGYDDVEPFIMKDDIYIKSVAKNNRDITKLNDAIAKNNTDLIEEEKEQILEANKAKRKESKKEHVEKMEKLQESIKNIRKEELTVNEKDSKINQFLSDEYVNKVNRDDWANAILDMDENDEALDEKDIEIANNEDVSVKEVTNLIKKVYLLDKKLNVNNVVELLNSDGLTNQDILKTLNFIDKNSKIDKTTVYKTANALASVIGLIYSINFDK